MRLICPNCGAQYEVDESVIPDAGRDVQCSNCGHAWFQQSAAQIRAAAEAEAAAEMDDWDEVEDDLAEDEVTAGEADAEVEAPQAPEPDLDDEIEEPVAEDSAEPTAPAPDPEDDYADQVAAALAGLSDEVVAEPEPETAAPAAAPDVPKRRTLDDAVLSILREEAEREARARQSGSGPIETQPDLGLDEPAAVPSIAPTMVAAAASAYAARADEEEEVAHVRGDETEGEELVSRSARRELLPDIEEINSTLRAASDRGDDAAARDAPEVLRRRKSGFRMGFSIAMLATLALLLVYILAPVIAEKVPGMAPSLASYVEAVDALRLWLEQKMKLSTEAMLSR